MWKKTNNIFWKNKILHNWSFGSGKYFSFSRIQNQLIFLRRSLFGDFEIVHINAPGWKICHGVFTTFLEPVNGHIFFQLLSREHRICLLDPSRSTDRQHGSIESGLFIPGFSSHVKVMNKWPISHPFFPFSIIRRYLGSSFFLFFSPGIAHPYTNPIHPTLWYHPSL